MLDQEYKEAREIYLDYIDGKETFENCRKKFILKKPAAEATKKIVAIAMIAARCGDKKSYNRAMKRLVGSTGLSDNQLLIQPPEEIYNRTIDRGR